jgi:hypothetical protein
MKATNLIELIDSILNEDNYKKFTSEQLYMKLGPQKFMGYVGNIISSGLKRIKNITPIKDVVPVVAKNDFIGSYVVHFSYRSGELRESISVGYPGYLICHYSIGGSFTKYFKVGKDETGFDTLLIKNLSKLYNSSEAKQLRNNLLS